MNAPDLSSSVLELSLACGLHLRIDVETNSSSKTVAAALYTNGSWEGERIALLIAYNGKVRVAQGADGVWFDMAKLSLEWHSLLRVADFLHLDIPQPELPAGQEVPR